jgi:glycosyltransferase involved in cell wall biosynthesis
MSEKIHAIILTLNEERHIQRCIESIRPLVSSVLVVDSGSTDRTLEIAKSLGAEVIERSWHNHATQFNHGVDHLAGKDGWLLRIDADEILEPADFDIQKFAQSKINGLSVQRRIYFMGRRMRFGGIEASWPLRLFRNGFGRCEQRWMDEHIVVEGAVEKSNLVLSDINLNSLHWWTEKHNSYASLEAIEVLNRKYNFLGDSIVQKNRLSIQATFRRTLKENLYLKLPSGLRAVIYFFYRYVLRGGFLDGTAGYYFHFLQGLWYRSLVDAKVKEIEAMVQEQKISFKAAILLKTGKHV